MFTVRKILPILLVLSFFTGPVYAWGWKGGDGDCPYSKSNSDQEQNKQAEESDD